MTGHAGRERRAREYFEANGKLRGRFALSLCSKLCDAVERKLGIRMDAVQREVMTMSFMAALNIYGLVERTDGQAEKST